AASRSAGVRNPGAATTSAPTAARPMDATRPSGGDCPPALTRAAEGAVFACPTLPPRADPFLWSAGVYPLAANPRPVAPWHHACGPQQVKIPAHGQHSEPAAALSHGGAGAEACHPQQALHGKL